MPMVDKVTHARLELWIPFYNVEVAAAGNIVAAVAAVVSHSGKGERGALRRHSRAGPPGPRARGLRVVVRRQRVLLKLAMAALVVEYGE